MTEYLELFKTFTSTGQMGFWTYWLPMILCVIGYSGRTWVQVKNIRNRKSYVPPLTVGTILGRAICSVTPILNVVCLVFGLSYDMLRRCAGWVEAVLRFELVKKST